MENLLLTALYISLLIHVLLMCFAAWRLWNGENVIDRLMASDMLSNLCLAVLVLAALIHRQKIYIDVALGTGCHRVHHNYCLCQIHCRQTYVLRVLLWKRFFKSLQLLLS